MPTPGTPNRAAPTHRNATTPTPNARYTPPTGTTVTPAPALPGRAGVSPGLTRPVIVAHATTPTPPHRRIGCHLPAPNDSNAPSAPSTLHAPPRALSPSCHEPTSFAAWRRGALPAMFECSPGHYQLPAGLPAQLSPGTVTRRPANAEPGSLLLPGQRTALVMSAFPYSQTDTCLSESARWIENQPDHENLLCSGATKKERPEPLAGLGRSVAAAAYSRAYMAP